MKLKFELIKELNEKSYYHVFLPEKRSEEIMAKLVKFYFEEDIYLDAHTLPIEFILTQKFPLILFFDKNNTISAMVTLNETSFFNSNLYLIAGYVGKKHRMNRITKNSLLAYYLWPLAYYESCEYLQLTGNKDNIVGLFATIGNQKVFEKYCKKRTYIDTQYCHWYYLGDKRYALYYPDTCISEDAF